MRKLMTNISGDTIVEVLIAIIVVSTVLAGAYASSNRSLKATRQAQEHTEALKFAQGQLEALRSLGDAAFGRTSIFCIDRTTGSVNNVTSGSPGDLIANNPVTVGPSCTFNNGIDYEVAIDFTHVGSQYSFTVFVVWPSISGNGNDKVTLSYILEE